MEKQTVWIQTHKNGYECIDLWDMVELESKLWENKIDRELVIVTRDDRQITIKEQYKGKSMFLFESFVEYVQHNNALAYGELRKNIRIYNDAINHQYHLESAKEFLQRKVDSEEES